jgi:hypothetical protein
MSLSTCDWAVHPTDLRSLNHFSGYLSDCCEYVTNVIGHEVMRVTNCRLEGPSGHPCSYSLSALDDEGQRWSGSATGPDGPALMWRCRKSRRPHRAHGMKHPHGCSKKLLPETGDLTEFSPFAPE